MRVWIVTGGIASGKSLLCQRIAEQVPRSVVISSDSLVHELLATAGIARLVATEFGNDILDPSGRVDRARLRDRILAADADRDYTRSKDQTARGRLEAILHPAVYQAIEEKRASLAAGRNTELLIAEVPLFYESTGEFPADMVIVAATGSTLQQERLTGPRRLDPVTAERFRAAQWPLTRKLDPADKVVWNEGSLNLLELQAHILVQQLDNS